MLTYDAAAGGMEKKDRRRRRRKVLLIRGVGSAWKKPTVYAAALKHIFSFFHFLCMSYLYLFAFRTQQLVYICFSSLARFPLGPSSTRFWKPQCLLGSRNFLWLVSALRHPFFSLPPPWTGASPRSASIITRWDNRRRSRHTHWQLPWWHDKTTIWVLRSGSPALNQETPRETLRTLEVPAGKLVCSWYVVARSQSQKAEQM